MSPVSSVIIQNSFYHKKKLSARGQTLQWLSVRAPLAFLQLVSRPDSYRVAAVQECNEEKT